MKWNGSNHRKNAKTTLAVWKEVSTWCTHEWRHDQLCFEVLTCGNRVIVNAVG